MATTKWVLDPTHSEVTFKVKHLMFTNVSGNFTKFEATAESDDENFDNASFSFSADVDSINTNNADRDGHLKSADFFDAAQFPTITFTSTSVAKDGSDLKVTGDLTVHGVTKSVTLDTEFGGIQKDPWGNIKSGFSVTGKINRKDFGLSWNAALETGGVMLGEEVKLALELQFVKQ
jgi:polyisoprenoid-binding protein YceI